MASSNSEPLLSQQTELRVVGRVLNTLGVVFLSISVALTAALFEDISSVTRTLIGVAIAIGMVVGGEVLSRRKNANWWFPTTLMSAGYALAYFFAYSTYYVPNLRMLENPYVTWGLGLLLGAAGTYHGSINKQLRWFTSVFTVMVTGHALFHALSSDLVLNLGPLSVKVAAVGCFVGMIWCAALSSVYKRFEARYNWPGETTEEGANWLLHRVLHEAYFVFAALNAMALPLFLSSFSQAPIWWSLEAPILLALSWRSGNYFKHGVVGLIWIASVVTLLTTAFSHTVTLAVLVSVPVSGIAIGLAYRYVKSHWAQHLKVAGYCGYLYAAIAVALVAPYIQFNGFKEAMPYWMIQSLVLCGLGLALRDRIVHTAGWVVGLGALGLFGLQFHTWTWSLVAPVVVASYGLSIAYSRISNKGGWKQAEFLNFIEGETVTEVGAAKLEKLWSWVGGLTLFASSFLLLAAHQTVNFWSLEALTLVAVGFFWRKLDFRLQGLLAFALAAVKLAVWDLTNGFAGWFSADALTLYQAFQFALLGTCATAASFLYFRQEARLKALTEKQNADTAGGATPPAANSTPTDPTV